MTGLCHPGIYFSARKLSALTRLCALGHLNLDLLGTYQVAGSNAKSSGCHLLDGRTAVVVLRSRNQAFQALTALTGVGLAAQTVHGNGQSLVGLLGNRAVRHGTGLKTLHDGIHALDLINRDAAVFIEVKVNEASQVDGLFFLVQHMAVLFENLIISGPCRLLKQMDGTRIVKMLFLAGALLVASHTLQSQIHIQAQRVEGGGMQHIYIIGDVFQGDAAHTADGVGKVLVDNLLGDTNGLKDLGALVGLDGGNTHLGGDLDNAVKDCGVVIIYCCVIIFVQHLGLDQVMHRLLGQIRVDGTGAKAQQGCEVMYLSRLAALQDQGHGSTLLGLYQMLLQRRYR